MSPHAALPSRSTHIEVATDADLGAIRALLAQCRLPTADLEKSRPRFIVAREDAEIVGVGALELFGSTGLLRSVAVHARLRGTGLGKALVERLERDARTAHVSERVLLTETANVFFENRGYKAIDRKSVPRLVQDSEEFRSLCPQSASCLSKRLIDHETSDDSV
jgi:amino-acid N-acetyltransferase